MFFRIAKTAKSKSEKYTCLYLASKNGHKRLVKKLLEFEDIDPNLGGAETPLKIATIKGNEDVVRILLGHSKTDPDASSSCSSLLHAVKMENLEMVRLFLAHPNIKVNEWCMLDDTVLTNPLWLAVKLGKPAIVKAILSHHQVSLEAKENCEKTALFDYAISMGNEEIVEMVHHAFKVRGPLKLTLQQLLAASRAGVLSVFAKIPNLKDWLRSNLENNQKYTFEILSKLLSFKERLEQLKSDLQARFDIPISLEILRPISVNGDQIKDKSLKESLIDEVTKAIESAKDLQKSYLKVRFIGEGDLSEKDALREFIHLISLMILQNQNLFMRSPSTENYFPVHEATSTAEFYTLGVILAMALKHSVLLKAEISLALYKRILGVPFDLKDDMPHIDKDYISVIKRNM